MITTRIRQRLEKERAELLDATRHRIRDVRADSAAEAHVVRDEADVSAADVQAELELALLAMQSERLVKIESALEQIRDGSYGRCIDCGGGIAPARLHALPFAVRCVECQDALDQSTHTPAPSWHQYAVD